MVETVEVPVRDPARLREVLPPRAFDELERGAVRGRALFDGRVVWNVNSTARGGGVVELLRPLVGYARGFGIDARWVVLDADAPFYEIT
jgi:trehalose synthase